MTKPRVLLAIDRFGWAFDHIGRALARHLGDEFAFEAKPYREIASGDADIVVAFWWPTTPHLRADVKPRRGLVLCVYDGFSWRTSPHCAELAVKQCDVVATANRAIADAFPALGRPVHVVEDGVDCELFTAAPLPAQFVAGWVGNSGGPKTAGWQPDLKGVRILRAACEAARAPLVTRDLQDGGIWPHERMPAFYAGVSVVLCGSSSEGTPNPVLEAMACGRPVITTDVGIVRSGLVEHGVNGYVVDRTPAAFAAALGRLSNMPRAELEAMGAAARAAAERHDWAVKVGAWRGCLRGALATARAA